MKEYAIAIYSDHPEVHFEHRTAARLARVSEAFIHRCEREGLVTSKIMLHGKRGLCIADVRKLKRIRHLHEDMGLDLEAADFVLRYRNCIVKMGCRMEEMERRIRRKEREHLKEISDLHRRMVSILTAD